MNDKDYKILQAMTLNGGSFAKAIARAALLADSENYTKLKAAFPELWAKYAAFAQVYN